MRPLLLNSVPIIFSLCLMMFPLSSMAGADNMTVTSTTGDTFTLVTSAGTYSSNSSVTINIDDILELTSGGSVSITADGPVTITGPISLGGSLSINSDVINIDNNATINAIFVGGSTISISGSPSLTGFPGSGSVLINSTGPDIAVRGPSILTVNNTGGPIVVGVTHDDVVISSGTQGTISLREFSASLLANNHGPESVNSMINLPLNGAHHRPLLSYEALSNRNCAWATGDYARYGRDQDADAKFMEIGGCRDLIEQKLRVGFGVGKSFGSQDLAFNGGSRLDGEYIFMEADYRPLTFPVIASLAWIYGKWDADIDRGYLNAGNQDMSYGKTDADNIAARGRLDWVNAVSVENINFTPRVSFTWMHTVMDGYTETGGGFPARFNKRAKSIKELRYGIDARRKFGDKLWGSIMVEGVHRLNTDAPPVSGQVIGLFPFSLPGIAGRRNWARAGAEVEYLYNDSLLLSSDFHVSSKGEDPQISGSVSLKVIF